MVLKKPLLWTHLIIFLLAFATLCLAGSIYTWKDAQGVTHITETPPPPNARGQDVFNYRPRTDAELKAIEEEKMALKKQLETKAADQKAMNARVRAKEASQRATDAEAAAEAAQNEADEFTKQASTNWRRYHRNKATILRLEAEAEAARQKAQQEQESAQSAADRAAEAEKKATASDPK
jgi:type IV secretory pathway VirB10-like protein